MIRISLQSILLLCLFVLSLCHLHSCKDDTAAYPPIVMEQVNPEEGISLYRNVKRNILLKGGNGKYKAQVADSRVAAVKVINDTLKVDALFEGNTFATIRSAGISQQLPIKVVYPRLTFSTDSIRLFPKDRTRFVTLMGGDIHTRIIVDDPDDILQAKWDARSHIVEINAYYEGLVTITAIAEDGDKAVLKVRVMAVDQPTECGIYGTGNKYFSNNKSINNVLVVHRPHQGTWISSVASPYGGWAYTYQGTVLHISTIVAPKVGERREIEIKRLTGPRTSITEGIYRAVVEKVDDEKVVLRTPRHKLILPYTP